MSQIEPDLTTKLSEIEAKLSAINERNLKVETEKAWETSATRRMAVLSLTYFLMSLVFYIIGIDRFLINALVPTIAYYLSTLSLPVLKGWWLERTARNR